MWIIEVAPMNEVNIAIVIYRLPTDVHRGALFENLRMAIWKRNGPSACWSGGGSAWASCQRREKEEIIDKSHIILSRDNGGEGAANTAEPHSDNWKSLRRGRDLGTVLLYI